MFLLNSKFQDELDETLITMLKEASSIDPRPSTLDPRPSTLGPRPSTQDPRPSTQDPRQANDQSRRSLDPRPASADPHRHRYKDSEPKIFFNFIWLIVR